MPTTDCPTKNPQTPSRSVNNPPMFLKEKDSEKQRKQGKNKNKKEWLLASIKNGPNVTIRVSQIPNLESQISKKEFFLPNQNSISPRFLSCSFSTSPHCGKDSIASSPPQNWLLFSFFARKWV
uniref:Uncharacterized protein n=1 Tax=Caenorhabditis japonica TaxID=281687 RepID=A0A8R1EP30_CAEJA